MTVTMSVSSFDEGDSGDGGVIDSSVPELSRWWLVPATSFEKTVELSADPFTVMLTRDAQSGVTVTSPIASSEVHFRRSSMAEGCGWRERGRMENNQLMLNQLSYIEG